MVMEKVESKYSSSSITVEHFHSRVVETIALLNLKKEQTADYQIGDLEKWVSEESRQFIQKWRSESTIDFHQFLGFLIPCPYFHDMELFVTKLEELSQEEYLYHIFGEEISKEIIANLLSKPSSMIYQYESIIWDTSLKKEFIVKFIENLTEYRTALRRLLLEISSSNQFSKMMAKKEDMIQQSLLRIKELPMKPLTLAQYIMGKNFRRVSDYKIYYFIPSYFFTMRMRIFTNSICMVFYNCSKPLSDDLQQSKDIDAKLKAIADPNRLLLLRMLSNQKLYGARLAEYLGVTTATVSHHLELLKKADFITEEKVGTIKYFTCNKDKITKFLEKLNHFIMM